MAWIRCQDLAVELRRRVQLSGLMRLKAAAKRSASFAACVAVAPKRCSFASVRRSLQFNSYTFVEFE